MKNIKLSIFGLLVFTLICCFFAPFFLDSSSFYSFVDLINNGTFNGYFALNILPFILYLVALVLQLFGKKNNKFILVSFLLNICSITLTVFEPTFAKMAISYLSNGVQFAVGAIVFILSETCFAIFQSRCLFDSFKIGIRDIIEIGIFVAFAIVLDLGIFKIRIGANGGSISLVMIPLLIICLRKGFLKGFIATGIVYGLVNCLLDGYGLMYYPFDYLLGFGSLAIVGLFRRIIFDNTRKIHSYVFLCVGVVCAIVARLLCSTLSGIIYYHLTFWESFIYNIAYIGPSGAVSLVALFLLLPVIRKMQKRSKN